MNTATSGLSNLWGREPAMVLELVRLIVLLVMTFGVVLTNIQFLLVMAIVSLLLTLITRAQVTPARVAPVAAPPTAPPVSVGFEDVAKG